MEEGGTQEVVVHTPPIYWGRINGWSILATACTGVTAVIAGAVIGSLWLGETNSLLKNSVTKQELAAALNPIVSRLDKSEGFQTDRAFATDKSLDEMRTLVAPVAGTVFRLSQLEANTIELRSKTEASDRALNERVDGIAEKIDDKLDRIIQGQAETSTAIRVQGSQIEDLRDRIDDTSTRRPQKLLWRSGVPHPDRPSSNVPAP